MSLFCVFEEDNLYSNEFHQILEKYNTSISQIFSIVLANILAYIFLMKFWKYFSSPYDLFFQSFRLENCRSLKNFVPYGLFILLVDCSFLAMLLCRSDAYDVTVKCPFEKEAISILKSRWRKKRHTLLLTLCCLQKQICWKRAPKWPLHSNGHSIGFLKFVQLGEPFAFCWKLFYWMKNASHKVTCSKFNKFEYFNF